MASPKPDPSFKWAKTGVASLQLSGKQVAVVGGTDGLGRAIAHACAKQGADVIVVGRTDRDPGAERIAFVKCDLSLMREARRLGASDALPPSLDVLVFTNGILAAPKREETPEGLERDMAVSMLSRLAIMDEYAKRLRAYRGEPRAPLRVFVMGFPGAGQDANPEDLNGVKEYGFWKQHMATVACNEAMVLGAKDDWGDGGAGRGVEAFGLNPGLVKTSIRNNLTGTGTLARAMEWFLGLLTNTPDQYAAKVVPLLFAPELSGQGGRSFSNRADAIKLSPPLAKPEHVAALLKAARDLIERGTNATLTSPAPQK